MFVVIEVLGILAVTLVKVSALHLFMVIFENRRFHQVAYAVLCFIILYGIAFTITTFASCRPFAFNWDKTMKDGVCVDTSKYFVAQTTSGVLLDALVVALPMPMLWGLKMRVQKKISLTCIFGMGIL